MPVAALCGLCGGYIEQGSPALFIRLPNVKRERIRCAACIGDAPPDLPALIVRSTLVKPMQPLKRAIPPDWKLAQSRDES